jgi:hypothetical protein
MTPTSRRPTRRAVMASGASLTAGALVFGVPAAAQSDRDLLALLIRVELAQIGHYTALLAAFDNAAFAATSLPERARGDAAAVLAAEQLHLAALLAPGEAPPTPPAAPAPVDLLAGLRDAAGLEELATATYAGVIPLLERQRRIPGLLGIESVEARHASWLATLLGANPFPNAIDTALAPEAALGQLIAVGPAAATPPPAATPTAGDADLAALVPLAAAALSVAPEQVRLVTVERQIWPDASLGCPQPDHVYAQVLTPGYRLVVEAPGGQFELHSDERGNIVRCS